MILEGSDQQMASLVRDSMTQKGIDIKLGTILSILKIDNKLAVDVTTFDKPNEYTFLKSI